MPAPNRWPLTGVFADGAPMDVAAEACPDLLVTPDTSIEMEFEQRLADSASLAFRVALGVLRNREDAEEIAQEAFIRAHKNFVSLRDRERFRGWLARISFRLALDRLRSAGRRQRREQVVYQQQQTEPSVEGLAASRQFQERLERAIDVLPEKLRVVLLLAAIEGHDTREVARLLDIPEGTVKSRLHVARKTLADQMRPWR
jgi:RNA polymerase sigma-70 factor (ECF subfamily)